MSLGEWAVVAVAEPLVCETVVQGVASELSGWQIDVVQSLAQVRERMASGRVALLVVAHRLADGYALDLMAEVRCGHPSLCVVVLCDSHEPHGVWVVRALGVHGAIDLRVDGKAEMREAVRQSLCGGNGWSDSLRRCLQGKGMLAEVRGALALSPGERFVLSCLGTGADDATAADRWGLTANGVHEVRKRLHRKLGLRQRAELVLVAVQSGLVHASARGIEQPGERRLRALSRLRCRRVGGASPIDI